MGNDIVIPKEQFHDKNLRQNPNSIWILANGYIYDVTNFIEHHPGGKEALLKRNGCDCTIDYEFHSSFAKKMWSKFKIGKINK